MAREPIPTWMFSLVIVRLGRRFLIVRERKHGQLWYLPAGRVEPGETFAQAARREVREEAGIDVHLEGILRVEHTPQPRGSARVRVIFVARPVDDTPPKSRPDEESLEARWVTLDELAALPQRGEEVAALFEEVAGSPLVMPMSMLGVEGAARQKV